MIMDWKWGKVRLLTLRQTPAIVRKETLNAKFKEKKENKKEDSRAILTEMARSIKNKEEKIIFLFSNFLKKGANSYLFSFSCL